MTNLRFNSSNYNSLPVPDSKYVLYKHYDYSHICLKVTHKGKRNLLVRLQNGNKKVLKAKPNEITKAKKEAQGFRDAYDDYRDGKKINPKDIPLITFFDMARKYLKWAKNNKSEGTIISDRKNLNNHLLPALSEKNPAELSSRDIHSLLNSLIGKKNSYTYLKSIDGQSTKYITKSKVTYWFSKIGYNNTEINDETISNLNNKNIVSFLSDITDNKSLVAAYISDTAKYTIKETVTSYGTFNKCKALLSHMYNTAMTWEGAEWEQIKANPCVGIKSTKPKQKNRYLDDKELDRLKAVLNSDEYKNDTIGQLVKFLILTGARRSEALTAKWEDIDFNNKVWRKPAKNSKTKLAPPVSISKDVINLLNNMKASSLEGYIFKSAVTPDKPINDFRKSFNTIMAKADIKDITPHDLRRTFGTQLLLSGVDIFTVSKLLGHESVKTTESHYAFLNRETMHTAVNALDGML